jgi:hypothetical protein
MSSMDLSANEAAETHFRGTRYAYDRREVDAFRERVVASLAAYEQALGDAKARIAELEKAQIPAFRRSGGRPVGTEPSTPTSDPLEMFERWRAEQQTLAELDAMLDAAREEARMVRSVAVEQAADEIAVLTSQARDEALAVTRRAAQLASETEEAARRRADEIIESVPVPAGTEAGTVGDVDEISRRIVHLRSSIAAVQNRLESLVLDPHQAGGEVIEIDLRNDPNAPGPEPEPKSSAKRKRKKKRAKAAAEPAPSAQEIQDRVAQLRERLGSD